MRNILLMALASLINSYAPEETISIKKNNIVWNIYVPQSILGYYVYYGIAPDDYIERIKIQGRYTQNFDLRKLPLLPRYLYYISITAYTTKNMTVTEIEGKKVTTRTKKILVESNHSNELTFIRPERFSKRLSYKKVLLELNPPSKTKGED